MSDDKNAKIIKACMVSYYFFPEYSGSAVQAYNLSRHLLKLGIQPFIVTANLSSQKNRDEIGGIPIFRIPIINNKNFAIISFWISLALFLIKKRKDFDIIHAHGTYQHGIASIIGFLLRKKTILKVAMANSDIAFKQQGRLWGRLNKFYVSHFDKYIATSKNIYQEFVSQRLDEEKIELIPNGVDIDIFKPLQSEKEKEKLKLKLNLPLVPLVIYVGIINSRKNIDFILTTWKDIRKKKTDCHLILLGPIPDSEISYYNQLLSFIKKNQLDESLSFLGFKDDTACYFQAADIFFFPSKNEGMPNVLLEAMSSGLPCVVSRISGTEDIIEDKITGFLIDLDDDLSATGTLLDLLNNSGMKKGIGKKSRELIINDFSLQNTAIKYRKIYQDLLFK